MLECVQIKDKTFNLSISEKEINAAIDKIADQMKNDLQDKNPIFLAVLDGSFIFAAELMKRVNIPSQISFIKVKSYDGLQTTHKYNEVLGLSEEITNRTVVVLEDIIDSGFTMRNIIDVLCKKDPKEIKIATLLFKPEALQCDISIDYVALNIPNDFIVGYGLDYDGYGRNLRNIYSINS